MRAAGAGAGFGLLSLLVAQCAINSAALAAEERWVGQLLMTHQPEERGCPVSSGSWLVVLIGGRTSTYLACVRQADRQTDRPSRASVSVFSWPRCVLRRQTHSRWLLIGGMDAEGP